MRLVDVRILSKGLNHRQLTAGSFLTLIAEHLQVRGNSAEATSTLLCGVTDAATGSLPPLSVTEHHTSDAELCL